MAEQILKDISFEEWVAHLFDHEVREPEWHFDLDAPHWDGDPETAVRYITQLFEDPGAYLEHFNDAQLNQGLWFLISESCSDYIHAVHDESVPLESRLRCVQGIYSIFEKLFAVRCSPHLSNIDEPGASPLNLVCYMWWEFFPTRRGEPGNRAKKELDEMFLKIMEQTLALSSIACRESALHGLGHWQLYYPTETARIVDAFLSSTPNLSEGLSDYAKAAREGYVN